MMKKLLLLLMVASATFAFVSCSKDDEDDSPAESTETYEALGFDAPKFDKESALYLITSAGSGIYSIELTPTGEYIVMDEEDGAKASPMLSPRRSNMYKSTHQTRNSWATRSSSDGYVSYGKYTKTGDGQYKLEGYGTIAVKGGEGNAVSLTITLLNGNKINVGAMKRNQYSSTPVTNAICRKWKLGKCVLHKKTGDVTYSSIEDMDRHEETNFSEDEVEWEPVEILFTKSGSYIVFFTNQTLDVSTWAWTNESTGEARYSWDWDNLYSGESGVILFEFEGKKLLITEAATEYSDAITYYCTEVK